MRLDPNLAQIKALQQYLELKLIQGSLGINSLSHLQRESDGYEVGRMDNFKPIVVLNLWNSSFIDRSYNN